MLIDLNHLKSTIDIPDSLVEHVNTFIVPGALDREKILSATCAIRLAGIVSRKFTVLSIGAEADALKLIARAAAAAFGYELSIATFPASVDLATLDNHSPACLLISIPELFLGRTDIILHLAARMPPGSAIFLASNSDATWASNVLPSRALIEGLQRVGFEPAHLEYYALLYKPLNPIASPVPLSSQEQSRCLFVFGHARSGSSPVAAVVSSEPDCLMTFEANWYMPVNRRHPIDQFNLQQQIYSRRLTKTHFLPKCLPAATTVEDLFRWGLDRYKLFGDKIAVSVREKPWDKHPVKYAFEYQMNNFPAALYLLTFRRPREAILAQSKIKPGFSALTLTNWWTTAAYCLINLLTLTDRAALMPFDWLKEGRLTPLEQLTSRSFDHPNFAFDPREVTTTQDQADMYWSKQPKPVVDLVDEAQALYSLVLSHLNPETGRLAHGVSQGELEEALLAMSSIADRAETMERDQI